MVRRGRPIVNTDRSKLAVAIRAVRESEGMPQTELAARLGVGLRTVQGWEAGRTRPSPWHVAAMVRALGPSALEALVAALPVDFMANRVSFPRSGFRGASGAICHA